MGRGSAIGDLKEVASERTGALVESQQGALPAPPEEQAGTEFGRVDLAKPPTQTARAAKLKTTTPEAEDSLGSAPEARTKPERALLRVLADPWGNVWIDDEKVGRAPVRRLVRPGTHKVQIGDEYPETPKYVKVGPGESRKITLRKAEIE
jgi:hypothetical protein